MQRLEQQGYELRELEYEVSGGWLFTHQLDQRAFLVMPAEELPLQSLWVVHGGNAGLATLWLPFILDVLERTSHEMQPKRAFLLIDYPGYGYNSGNPNSYVTLKASESAVKESLAILHPRPVPEICYLGYSLGGAAVMQLAANFAQSPPSWLGSVRPVGQVVLAATFTSIPGMGR
eukprot:1700645-Amphidinium_carterae.1